MKDAQWGLERKAAYAAKLRKDPASSAAAERVARNHSLVGVLGRR